jgi:beta-N-acetylhexosaminidase
MKAHQLSDRQLAGQRLMAGLDGIDLNSDLKALIQDFKVGGLILFSRNLVDPKQIRPLCRSAQKYAAACSQPPLLIAIDQEGGQVARLKDPFTQFAGNPSMKSVRDAENFARITAEELSGVGINMNLAPVLDIVPDGLDGIMAQRSFGGDPAWVAKLGTVVIETLQQNGVMAVAKHFPGIGRTILDSHLDLPDLNVDIADLEGFDLIPFQAAIAHQVAGIMLSHIRYTGVDPVYPAGFSPEIARLLLRGRMGYEGLVMTDDLDMGAVTRHFDIHAVVDQLLRCAVDIVLICHKGPNIETAYNRILENIEGSTEIRKSGIRSVQRILQAKAAYLTQK